MEYPEDEKKDAVKSRSKQNIITSFINNFKLLKIYLLELK